MYPTSSHLVDANGVQAHLAEKDKEIRALQLRIERQQADIEQLRNQYRTAQQNYDRQVHCCLGQAICLLPVRWSHLQTMHYSVRATGGGACGSSQQGECPGDCCRIRRAARAGGCQRHCGSAEREGKPFATCMTCPNICLYIMQCVPEI